MRNESRDATEARPPTGASMILWQWANAHYDVVAYRIASRSEGEWVEWTGFGTSGAIEPPIPDDMQIEVRYRLGDTEQGFRTDFDWGSLDDEVMGRIVAYRVLKS